MQCLRNRSNAIKNGYGRYDQSVTCLADDPQNLETRSSTLRTPGTLSQTNNNIHKQKAKNAQVKLK